MCGPPREQCLGEDEPIESKLRRTEIYWEKEEIKVKRLESDNARLAAEVETLKANSIADKGLLQVKSAQLAQAQAKVGKLRAALEDCVKELQAPTFGIGGYLHASNVIHRAKHALGGGE